MKKVISRILKNFLLLLGIRIKKNRKYDIPHYVKLYAPESIKHRKFYNISVGAYKGFGGGFFHPCWTNIDVNRSWKNDRFFPKATEYNPDIDIAHDLLSGKPLPIDSLYAELVHSRFTVDRLPDKKAQFFFNEIYRILKKGGIFRIVSTNVDLDYRAYQKKDSDYYFWCDERFSTEQAFLYHVFTQLSTVYPNPENVKISDEELNRLFNEKKYEDALDDLTSRCSEEIQKNHRYDHLNWWNHKKFEKMLSAAGFESIYRSYPEQSAAPVMRNEYYFDNDHHKVMMYMEAVKI